MIFLVGLLYESEKVGLATAEELQRQKEQLKQTEERYWNVILINPKRDIWSIEKFFLG